MNNQLCMHWPQERKHLALQLKDTKTVVGKLEAMCGIALHLIFILFYLVIFKVRLSSASAHLQLAQYIRQADLQVYLARCAGLICTWHLCWVHSTRSVMQRAFLTSLLCMQQT